MASCIRLLEWIFFFYFFSHIPITLLVDVQPLFPAELFPASLKQLLAWYAVEFKDPMMADPPIWFKSFVYCELIIQLPFFPFAAYAFFKGGCKWIRTPAIIYGTHVATTVTAILAHILFQDFSESKHPGPETFEERLTLLSIYSPYFVIPVMIVLTMLYSPHYNTVEKMKAH